MHNVSQKVGRRAGQQRGHIEHSQIALANPLATIARKTPQRHGNVQAQYSGREGAQAVGAMLKPIE